MTTRNIDLIPEYRGNPFIEACGDILSPSELITRLRRIPVIPSDIVNIPLHLRRHLVPTVRDIFVPNSSSIKIAEAIDVMIRQGYAKRKPGTNDFWNSFYPNQIISPSPSCATVVGISGGGKTITIESNLNLYEQTYIHEKLPGFKGAFKQLIWIKVDAPESGRLSDLAKNLMIATDQALRSEYFVKTLSDEKKKGAQLFNEWLGIAQKHAIGLICIDEIQNLFKQASLKDRTRNHSTSRLELRLVEDESLKQIITATNTWRIPFLISGTPDGLAAFQTRLSTIQRLITNGYFEIERPSSADTPYYDKTFFPILSEFQFVHDKLAPDSAFKKLVYDLSAGVPRIIITLWIGAHYVAFDKGVDKLTFSHFNIAYDTYLKPIKPAVDALKSNDPRKLNLYEDLIPREAGFWNLS